MTGIIKHIYPLKIALRSRKLIQGSIFYNVFVDLASGQYVRGVPDAERKIRKLLLESGMKEETYEVSWSSFEEYMGEFQNPIYQYGIYSMISHWDWYISNLGKFVNFSKKYILKNDTDESVLLKLNRRPFREQIEKLEISTNQVFNFIDNSIDLIDEMHLVRNLGMHNEWEVDEDYLKKSINKDWKIGQKRIFEIEEIEKWHTALSDIISVTSNDIAILYAQIPTYE